MASSYSFDIVSEVDIQEADNAANQAAKEIASRYDLKGKNVELEFDRTGKEVRVRAEEEYHLSAALEIFRQKCIKRGISVLALDEQKPEHTGGKTIRQLVKFKNGLEREDAKKITVLVKDSKLKVTAQVVDDKVRITGKSKDDLQDVMNLVRSADLPFPVQFNNYR